MKFLKKWWFLVVILAAFIIIVIIAWSMGYLSHCRDTKPDFTNEKDGVITPCPEGCILSSCYGIRTWCCPV